MRSPFPGMDPYLERRWSGFHVLMISAVVATLKGVLPAGLEARPDEEVRIETIIGDRPALRRPDVVVAEIESPPTMSSANLGSGGTSAVAERPIRIAYRRMSRKTRWISIVDAEQDDRVVTAIEILSPTNKRGGDDSRSYRRKLRTYERSDVNWVEIDLLRSSRRHLRVDRDLLPPGRRADYLALTFRTETDALDAYPIDLRSNLPTIDVPLRGVREMAPLDLQAAFDRAWRDGPFDNIDYTKPAEPPLSPEDAAWLAQRLAQRTAS